MKRQAWAALVFGAFLLLGAAQAQVTVSVAEHPEYGTYLTDGEGMTLYLFVQDAAALATPGAGEERMTEGVREQAAECTGGCLDNWPPLLAEGGEFTIAADAEGQLDPELLYVADVSGRSQMVYNGWPLYYFANDTQAGDVNGQGVGNRWFVINPEGQAEVAGGGEAAPAEEGAGEGDAPMDGGEAPADDGTDEPMDGGADEPIDGETDAPAGDGADQPMDGGTDAPADDGSDEPMDGGTDEAPQDDADGAGDAGGGTAN